MRIGSLAVIALGLAMFAANIVTAGEIKVASIPFKGPLDQIGPQFERATGHKLTIKYAPSGPLRKQIDAGEPFDVVLIFPNVVDDLIKQGKVALGTRMDIARAGLGLAVRKGAAKPDIRTTDAFKRALLTSASIAYAAQGPSGIHLIGLLDRLGIAQDVKPKLKPMGAGSLVVGPVARGEVEIGIVSIPFILAEPALNWRDRYRASCRIMSITHQALVLPPKTQTPQEHLSRFSDKQDQLEILRSHGLEALAQ